MEIRPICACCRQQLHTAWHAWTPVGTITCSAPLCVGWARSQGWQLHSHGLIDIRKGPVRPKGKPRCDYCRKERPPLRDCFLAGGGEIFCSLTCQQNAGY